MRKPVRPLLKAYNKYKKKEQQRLYRYMRLTKLRANHFQIFRYLYRYRHVVITTELLQAQFFPAEPDNLHNLHQAISEIRKRLSETGYILVNHHVPGKKRATIGYALIPEGFTPIFFRKSA